MLQKYFCLFVVDVVDVVIEFIIVLFILLLVKLYIVNFDIDVTCVVIINEILLFL